MLRRARVVGDAEVIRYLEARTKHASQSAFQIFPEGVGEVGAEISGHAAGEPYDAIACYPRTMDPEQLAFLQKRFRQASLEQPELRRLKALLLRMGGNFIVAPPKRDPDVPALLESGFVMSGSAILKRLKANMCHQNIATIWRAHKYGIIGIATGYALTEDGLWRQHTWGLLREGLLETTEMRLKYFGILLQGDKANHFANSNSSKND